MTHGKYIEWVQCGLDCEIGREEDGVRKQKMREIK